MGYLVYGLTITYFIWVGYETGKLVIGSVKDKLNGKN